MTDINVVQMDAVTRRFGASVALDDISFSLKRREIAGLIGRSGAGKSTLIRCLNGLDRPESGRVLIDGLDIAQLDESSLPAVRRRIGMVFQHFNLLSAKTVAENVALPLKIAGQPESARRKRVMELLDLVGLADKPDVYPAQLSGGQKQRVGIARALAPNPVLLLSDEATSALDPETTQSILDLLQSVNRQLGLSILLITHEIEVVRQIAHRVIVLDKGRIIEEGPVGKVLASPQTDTTRSLVRGLSPSLPDSILSRIHSFGGDHALVRVDLFGAGARQPVIDILAQAAAAPVRLLHGGLNDVQGEPYGRLFLTIATTEPDRVRAAVDAITPHATAIEVLGNVPHDL